MFNAIGALLWAVGITTLGYYIGKVSWIKENIEIASIAIVALSLVPIVLEVVKHRRAAKAEVAAAAAAAAAATELV